MFQSANKDPVVQMNQMQSMLSQGADVLVVNATSVKGQVPMMTQIASQVPVIYIDTSVPGTGTTSVQSDNLTIGRESGKITAKRFKDMGKPSIKMLILTGPATDEFVGPNRRKGFLDGLKGAASISKSCLNRRVTTSRTRVRWRPRTCSPHILMRTSSWG